MDKYTLGEWNIIIAAYGYEILDQPTMPDCRYDMLSKDIIITGCSIKDFDPSTGQWIQELIKNKLFKKIIHQATLEMLRLGEGTSPIHCVPKEYIKVLL